MRMVATRVTAGTDLRVALEELVKTENLSASVIVNATGSLTKAVVRTAGATSTDEGVMEFDGPFEIVSLMGIPQDTMHMHISVAGRDGSVIGGHMKYGCIVDTTVELVLLEDESQRFTREVDQTTGFDELVIGASK